MSVVTRSRSCISLLVVFLFSWFICVPALPVRAESRATAGESALCRINDSPGAVEKPADPTTAVKKKSILPWILAGAGVAAVAAVLFLVVLKKSGGGDWDSFKPRHPSYWSVVKGVYTCNLYVPGGTDTDWWEWSVYDRYQEGANYTVTAKMRMVGAANGCGVLLAKGNDMTSCDSYLFRFGGNPIMYRIIKTGSWDFAGIKGGVTWVDIRGWTSHSAINGVGSWNTVKIVKSGNTYTFYVNGTQVDSFSDAAFDPRYVCITGNTDTNSPTALLEVESFTISLDK